MCFNLLAVSVFFPVCFFFVKLPTDQISVALVIDLWSDLKLSWWLSSLLTIHSLTAAGFCHVTVYWLLNDGATLFLPGVTYDEFGWHRKKLSITLQKNTNLNIIMLI